MNMNYVDGQGIPLGFGMALAQNNEAMNYFASLDDQRKQEVINNCHGIQSKEEMRQYVSSLVEGNQFR